MDAPYWQGDGITLYHGDCRAVTEWLDADVLVTDPPYGIRYESGGMSNATVPLIANVNGDDSTDARDAALKLWGSRPAVVFGSWRRERPCRVTHRLT